MHFQRSSSVSLVIHKQIGELKKKSIYIYMIVQHYWRPTCGPLTSFGPFNDSDANREIEPEKKYCNFWFGNFFRLALV